MHSRSVQFNIVTGRAGPRGRCTLSQNYSTDTRTRIVVTSRYLLGHRRDPGAGGRVHWRRRRSVCECQCLRLDCITIRLSNASSAHVYALDVSSLFGVPRRSHCGRLVWAVGRSCARATVAALGCTLNSVRASTTTPGPASATSPRNRRTYCPPEDNTAFDARSSLSSRRGNVSFSRRVNRNQ